MKAPAWVEGLAEWIEGETTYLSVAFTWKLEEAYDRALFARAQGMKVMAGGPALFRPAVTEERKTDSEFVRAKARLGEIATVGGSYPEAATKHNPLATFASRGCPVGCWFCVVPAMEGREFTLIPDFVPRPILCDNNLSGLPAEYQDFIVERYMAADVKIKDANSGFEPRSFTPDVYARWKPLINAGGGPWRFAYDDLQERREVHAVMKMLAGERRERKRVYVLIGNEPFAECMQRIQEVIDAGCEPHVQPLMKLNALTRSPWVRHDWTDQKLRLVARWANRRIWKYAPFADFDPRLPGRSAQPEYDAQQGLFL